MFLKKKSRHIDEKSECCIYTIFDPEAKELPYSPPFFAANYISACLAVAETVCNHCTTEKGVYSSDFLRMQLCFVALFNLKDGDLYKASTFRSDFEDLFSEDFVRDYVHNYFQINRKEVKK